MFRIFLMLWMTPVAIIPLHVVSDSEVWLLSISVLLPATVSVLHVKYKHIRSESAHATGLDYLEEAKLLLSRGPDLCQCMSLLAWLDQQQIHLHAELPRMHCCSMPKRLAVRC